MKTATEEPPIVVKGLQNKFGKTTATAGISFNVPYNSIFALMGSNGAGKTTIIRTLTGILRPSKGETSVFGKSSTQLGKDEFRNIGYVAEGQEIPLGYTVKGYINYCKKMYPTWDDYFELRLLDMFKLPLDRKLKHLSRGMLIKAQLVTAIAHHPKLLILDEPFSGLDPLIRDQLIDALLDITVQEEWTILVSTHDVEEAERLADVICILSEGSLLTCLETDELLERFRKVQVKNLSETQEVAPREAWFEYRRDSNGAEYIESCFDEETHCAHAAEVWGSDSNITVKPMTLREIIISVLRNDKALEEQNK